MVDLVQARFGQELAIQGRESHEADCDISLDEANYPIAAQILLRSWRGSLAKLGAISGYGRSLSSATTHGFLADKSLSKKQEQISIIYSLLFFIALIIIQFMGSNTIGDKLVSSCVFTLLFGVVGWVIYEANKVSLLFKQTDKLRNIIFEIVDNSVDLKSIYTSTPRPWRGLFMGSPPLDLAGTAKLVAWNLDWYIKRPGLHFRTSWIVIIAIVGSMFGLALGMEPNYNFVIAFLLGIFACLIVHSLESWRKLTGLALLIEETKRIFSENENE